ncbi:hypothetical protein Agub_g1435 [Astrephomene gubernaculifera]|uniref:Uncharacterized protein n=1 Tax=Astrephomene gubernaculifera TaxID=47775 RepID=A0AAD3DFF3_9CHLO|nr:hypothetical protein Agub_g1435 [Astrephomene gubernaculifera]
MLKQLERHLTVQHSVKMTLNRDTKRVIQMLAPGMPAPVLDYVFAGMSKANANRTAHPSSGPPPPRYALRQCDAGPRGELSLLEVATVASNTTAIERFGNPEVLQFHYVPRP